MIFVNSIHFIDTFKQGEKAFIIWKQYYQSIIGRHSYPVKASSDLFPWIWNDYFNTASSRSMKTRSWSTDYYVHSRHSQIFTKFCSIRQDVFKENITFLCADDFIIHIQSSIHVKISPTTRRHLSRFSKKNLSVRFRIEYMTPRCYMHIHADSSNHPLHFITHLWSGHISGI